MAEITTKQIILAICVLPIVVILIFFLNVGLNPTATFIVFNSSNPNLNNSTTTIENIFGNDTVVITLNPIEDAWVIRDVVTGAGENTTFDTTEIEIGSNPDWVDNGGYAFSYLKFNLNSLPNGTILNSTLQLFGEPTIFGVYGISGREVFTNNWNESNLTAFNQPCGRGTIVLNVFNDASFNSNCANFQNAFGKTDGILNTTWVNNPIFNTTNVSINATQKDKMLSIVFDAVDGRNIYNSSENTYPPQLNITIFENPIYQYQTSTGFQFISEPKSQDSFIGLVIGAFIIIALFVGVIEYTKIIK